MRVTGPGGHSWSNFGEPNPITALARGIVRFSSISVRADPRTSYNFGVIEGGTAVNSIPAHAAVTVDLRSEEESELDRLETALREVMLTSVQTENSAAIPGSEALKVSFRSLDIRPGGKLPENAPLLATIRSVDRFLNNRTRLESASTDANIPLSLGIPAIAIGGGGSSGNTHKLTEWYDATGRASALKRLLLTILALAGVQP